LFSFLLFLLFTTILSKPKTIEFESLPDAENQTLYDKKWENFGAYYDKDEMKVVSTLKMGAMNVTFEIYKKIRILSTAGSVYGTVPVYQWSKNITHFDPRLYDANGIEIPLPEEKLKKEYLKTGKVVFPKVTAGSVVSLRIIFKKNEIYYYRWQQWYKYSIPVRIQRFIFAYSKTGEYDYRTYGTRYKFTESKIYDKNNNAHIFILNDFEPQQDIDYLDYAAITEPRIIFRLKNLHFFWYHKEDDLNKSAIKNFKKEIEEPSFAAIETACEEAVKKIIADTPDTLERARKILRWLQDKTTIRKSQKEITFSLENAANIRIASQCYKMFKRAGLNPHVLLAYDKNTDILDSSFLYYNEDIYGFPFFSFHNTSYIAYPYEIGYELGEYPAGFNNATCIDLKNNSISTLPPPLWGEEWIKDKIVLNLKSFPGNYHFIREFRKNSASDFRAYFLNMTKESQGKYIENLLKDYKKSNKVESFSILNLDEYEKPLITQAIFKNDDMPIPYENKTIFKLNNFFCNDYFEDITMERKDDIFLHHKRIYIDELEIIKIPGKKIIPTIEANNIINNLFSVEINKSETDSSYIFQRTVIYGKNNFISEEKIKDFYDAINDLNKVKNSTITISDK